MSDGANPKINEVGPKGPFTSLLWFSVLGFLQRATYLILLPIYLRYLSPSELGVLLLLMIASNIFVTVANLKLEAAMRTFYFDYADSSSSLQRYVSQIFSASLYLIAAFYLVMLFIGGPVYTVVFDHGDLRFYPLGAVALATVCVNLSLSAYFVYLRNCIKLAEFMKYQLFLIAGSISMQILLLTQLELGLRGVLVGALVPSMLALIFLIFRHPNLIVRRLDLSLLVPSLRYSMPLVAFSFLYLLESRLDRFVMEQNFDLEIVGIYVVFAAILGLSAILLNALDNAIRPFLFMALKNDSAEDVVTYHRLYLTVGLLSLSAVVFIGSNLGQFTSNDAYLSVRGLFTFGATAFLPAIFTRYYALLFVFHKRSVSLTVWMLIRTALMYWLLSWWIPLYEIKGALLAIFISQLVNAFVFRIQSRRFGAGNVPLANALVQSAVFLGTLWLMNGLLAEFSIGAYGAIQLIVLAGFLIFFNRDLVAKFNRT